MARHSSSRSFPDVFHHLLDLVDHIFFFQLRRASDFSKPVRYEAKACYIFLYFWHKPLLPMCFFQDFHPTLQRRNRCSELVGGFLCHAGPEVILRRPVIAAECEERNKNKKS